MSTTDLPESEYDKVGEFYIHWLYKNGSDRETVISPDIAIMLSMLGNIEGKCICDLGCGEGFLSRILAARGARVTGVDISRVLLGHAQKHPRQKNISYILEDAQSLNSITTSSMDGVICNMALMDIPDLPATFSAIRRVLIDGGPFVFQILHPCFFTPFDVRNPPEEIDSEDNFIALRTTRYSIEGKWYSGGTGMCGTLGGHHRMLSTYFNALSVNGFHLVELHEPIERVEEASTTRQKNNVVPTFLIAKSIAH